MNERDTTEVLIELLTEFKSFKSEVRSLSGEVAELAAAVGNLRDTLERNANATPPPETIAPPPEKWTEKVERFARSAEAEALATKRALTIDTVVAMLGCDISLGQRRWIGKILQNAGFSVVKLGGIEDFRKMAA